jgi:hypothetical protein
MTKNNLDTIILFDSNSSIDDIEEFFNKPDSLIISFDFTSHKLLTKHKIPHRISDNWIEEKEYSNIQKHTYKLSHWFEHPELDKKLEYDGINLGESIFQELLYSLPESITNFLKIRNIFLEYKNSKFLANGFLFNLINEITSNSLLLTSKKIKNDSDKIKYHLKFFNKNFSIKIPTKQYLFIKNNFERFLNYLINTKKPLNKNNNLLLVNFHTEKYASILNEAKNVPIQLYVYNTVMPNFWNHNSYSIIKKSKCHVINEPILSTSTKNMCKNNISQFKEQCKNLWGIEELFFESLFTYDNISLWNSFKNYFFNLYETKILEYLIQIEKIKIILDKYPIKNVLVWSEINPVDTIFLQLKNKYGYNIFRLQHGLYPNSKISDDFCNAFRIYGLKSDKYFVWGKSTKQHYLDHEFPDEQIIISGSTAHDSVFQNKEDSSVQNDYVLLGTNSPIDMFADEINTQIKQDYENTIKTICQEVIKNGKKLIVKFHPATNQMDLTSIIHEVDPSIPIFRRGELSKLMTNCELYVSAGNVSTSILDALIVNKPVIHVETKSHDLGKFDVLDYVLNSNIENFGVSLKKIISNDSFRNSLIKNGNTYVENYFSNRGNAASILLNYIKNIE